MKIAFLVGEFPSLSETFILNQITGLIDRGHDIDIYATTPNKVAKIHIGVEKYNLLNCSYYYPHIPNNYLLRAVKAVGLLLANCLKDPILLFRSLNIFKYGKKAASLRLLYLVIPFLRKRPRYDIICCHFGQNGLKGIFLREIEAIQGKLITAFYGLDITKYVLEHGEDVYKPLFDKGECFFPISKPMKHRLIELGCVNKKVILHRIGLDCRKFIFTPRQPHTSGQVRLITIARLVEKKGVEYGISAVAKLAKVNQNIEYNIVGDGDLREYLEQLILELDVGNIVKILGWKQQQEIIEILNTSQILLAPSVTSKDGDQEGTPVVIMEAMAMGLPVVSTQHSGIPELVENGVSGFLVPERDSDALAEKINYLIKHPELWLKMGQAGRSHVEEYYDINKLNDKLVKIYQQLNC